MNARIKVRFLGGVPYNDNITGSANLLTIEQGKQISRLLIDCGLVQCYKDSLARNRAILELAKPSMIDAVVLTHAHVDHGGRLPLLVKNGFYGRIFCTEATRRLLPVMLADSAKIQASEAARKTKVKQPAAARDENYGRDQLTRGSFDRRKNHDKDNRKKEKREPLYNMRDARRTCELIKNDGFPYQTWIRLAKGLELKFYPSGHVLGGAICVIRVESDPADIYLGFSGDLGRNDGVILPPPEMITEPISCWFTESTYGGKEHPAREEEIARLLDMIRSAAADGQKVIIPSFALERAQEIVYLLSYYMKIGEIPRVPMFLDSPMASEITKVFADSWEAGLFEGQDKLDFNPFSIGEDSFLQIVKDGLDSEALISRPGPYIVIAGSGMCDAGRVRSHLRAGLENPNTVVALVGYMAENSLGRKLKNGLPLVRMNGQEIMVKAKVVSFDSFSSHADNSHLVAYARELMSKNQDADHKIFLVHGEEHGATALKMELLQALPSDHWRKNIIIPKLGEEVFL